MGLVRNLGILNLLMFKVVLVEATFILSVALRLCTWFQMMLLIFILSQFD